MKIVLSILVIMSNLTASAQEAEGGGGGGGGAEFSEADLQSSNSSQYKKFNVKFDDELVKGAAEKPEAEYLFQKGDFNFKRLLRLRENFIPEVQKGKDDMRGK